MKKKILSVCLAAACALSSMALPAVAAEKAPALKLHYNFESYDDDLVLDAVGEYDGVTEIQPGNLNEDALVMNKGYISLKQEAANANNGSAHIKVPKEVFYDIGDSYASPEDTAYSMSFFFKSIDNPYDQCYDLIGAGPWNGGWGSFFNFRYVSPDRDPACIQLTTKTDGQGYGEGEAFVDYNVPNDVWTHIVLVQDGRNAAIYVNGEKMHDEPLEFNLAEYVANTWRDGPAEITLGAGAGLGGDMGFNGDIDDFKIYSGALTDSDVMDEYKALVGSTEIASLKVDGVDAVRDGDTYTATVYAGTEHKTDVIIADANGSYVIEGDKITVTSRLGETKVYTLKIVEKTKPSEDNKDNNNTNTNKPADTKKPVVSKKATVKKVTIKHGKKIVSKKKLTVKLKKKSVKLAAVVTGKNLKKADKKVKWSTSKKKIATVKNGKVTFKKKGTVKITVKTVKGNKKATVTIKIK